MPARPSASDSGGSTACGAKAGRPPPRIQRERQSSSQQRAVRTQSRSSRSGTGRPACASSCSRRRPCTARGSTCCPTPPRPPRPCPAPARRRTPCRRAPRGRTIGPTRARGNEGTFFTIDAVRPRLLFSDLLPLLGPHPSGARPFGSEGRVARARGLPPAHAEACVAVWPALAWVFIFEIHSIQFTAKKCISGARPLRRHSTRIIEMHSL